jgi:hypothetical protein
LGGGWRLLGRPGRISEDNIYADAEETGFDDERWTKQLGTTWVTSALSLRIVLSVG